MRGSYLTEEARDIYIQYGRSGHRVKYGLDHWTVGLFFKTISWNIYFFKGWVGSFVGGLSYVLPHAGRGR